MRVNKPEPTFDAKKYADVKGRAYDEAKGYQYYPEPVDKGIEERKPVGRLYIRAQIHNVLIRFSMRDRETVYYAVVCDDNGEITQISRGREVTQYRFAGNAKFIRERAKQLGVKRIIWDTGIRELEWGVLKGEEFL